MRLVSVELADFRNIAKAQLSLSPHFNLLIGQNGQGKTNCLEALYLVGALRPLRPVARKALIRAGTKVAKVKLSVEHLRTGLVHELQVTLDGTSRVLEKDGKHAETTAFLGTFVAVAFTPDDLQLAKGGPDARRRFLDRALLNVKPAYLQRALRYARGVKDRNRALVEQANDDVIDAFDAVIAQEGAAIMVARAHYTSEVTPRIEEHFVRIASPAPVMSVRYAASLGERLDPSSEEATRSAFADRLRDRRSLDRRKRTTSVGPHLDDLEITLDGVSARDRASQGQHRALVLALKLAEITHLAERLGEAPVLLLDDMSSELDALRSRQLFDTIGHLEGQVVLTSTEEPSALASVLESEHEVVRYSVEQGKLNRA